MKVFCVFIKEKISEKFGIDVDVLISRKKRLVHFTFKKPLTSHVFFNYLIVFVKNEWEKRQRFLENYEIINPRFVYSLKWRFDYVFFQLKKGKMERRQQNELENICDNITDAIQSRFVRKHYVTIISQSKNGNIYLIMKKKRTSCWCRKGMFL